MPEQKICIEVNDLIKTYKRGQVHALSGVNLSVSAGEVFGLIGPNGAGKSTLLGCLLGLLRPDSGSIRIMGKPADFLSVRRITGYLPERPDFEQWMTGRQFLQYHHMLAKRSKLTVSEDIEEALCTVELDRSAWNRKLGTYSRGMLQRLGLAQVIIGQPKILFLDEPTLGLDPTGVAVVRKFLHNLRDSGVTAVINSHQLDEVERECDRVAFMRHGRIEQIENLKQSANGPFVLFIRWSEDTGNGGITSAVNQIAASAGISIKEANCSWARFNIPSGKDATTLIKKLITAGYSVEEAVMERSRLEQLFHKNAEAIANE